MTVCPSAANMWQNGTSNVRSFALSNQFSTTLSSTPFLALLRDDLRVPLLQSRLNLNSCNHLFGPAGLIGMNHDGRQLRLTGLVEVNRYSFEHLEDVSRGERLATDIQTTTNGIDRTAQFIDRVLVLLFRNIARRSL